MAGLRCFLALAACVRVEAFAPRVVCAAARPVALSAGEEFSEGDEIETDGIELEDLLEYRATIQAAVASVAARKGTARLALAPSSELLALVAHGDGVRTFIAETVEGASRLADALPSRSRFVAKRPPRPKDTRALKKLGKSLDFIVVENAVDAARVVALEFGTAGRREPTRVSASRARHLARESAARDEKEREKREQWSGPGVLASASASAADSAIAETSCGFFEASLETDVAATLQLALALAEKNERSSVALFVPFSAASLSAVPVATSEIDVFFVLEDLAHARTELEHELFAKFRPPPDTDLEAMPNPAEFQLGAGVSARALARPRTPSPSEQPAN